MTDPQKKDSKSLTLSIIIPVYYNEPNLKPLYDDIKAKIIDTVDFNYELIMVDDGSHDDSWTEMQKLARLDSHIRIVRLSRNFGSHAAILCGLNHCTGDCAVIKAADLQEPTELLLQMFDRWKVGNEVVLAIRADREESFSQKLFANTYYWIVRKFALANMPEDGFDIFLLDRKVIDVLKRMNENDSAITGQILWSGFRTALIPYVRKARTIGKSRWTLKKKIKLVMDTLYGFSTVPITMVSCVGFLSVVGSLIWALIVLFSKLKGAIEVSGWTTLFIFNLFSFGITMSTLGVLGGYLWRTFNAARKRPVYIVAETKSSCVDADTKNTGSPAL